MSVLIKGMKMPECCADCDLHNPFAETPYCRRLLRAIPLEGRLENCPLVEVPTPHGWLIDAEELLKHKGSAWDEEDHEIYVVGTGDIMCAKTVIEAEE